MSAPDTAPTGMQHEDVLLDRLEALEGWVGVFAQRYREQRAELEQLREKHRGAMDDRTRFYDALKYVRARVDLLILALSKLTAETAKAPSAPALWGELRQELNRLGDSVDMVLRGGTPEGLR